jgi:D-methionine transport system substrate-binding protein
LYGNPGQNTKSVSDIKDGANVVIPNDETNQTRALFVLESVGLIKLKDPNNYSAGPEDIVQGESKVKVTPIATNQTAQKLSDSSIVAAVINNDYVNDAGLDPKDAIAEDDPKSDYAKRWINVWVVREQDKDNDVYKKIVQIATTDKDFWDAIYEESADTAIDARNSTADELSKITKSLQGELKKK